MRGIPIFTFVNKMDRVGADFSQVVTGIRKRLGAKSVALQLPIGAEDQFSGIIDIVRMKAFLYQDELGTTPVMADIPEELSEEAQAAHDHMIESLADFDEAIM